MKQAVAQRKEQERLDLQATIRDLDMDLDVLDRYNRLPHLMQDGNDRRIEDILFRYEETDTFAAVRAMENLLNEARDQLAAMEGDVPLDEQIKASTEPIYQDHRDSLSHDLAAGMKIAAALSLAAVTATFAVLAGDATSEESGRHLLLAIKYGLAAIFVPIGYFAVLMLAKTLDVIRWRIDRASQKGALAGDPSNWGFIGFGLFTLAVQVVCLAVAMFQVYQLAANVVG